MSQSDEILTNSQLDYIEKMVSGEESVLSLSQPVVVTYRALLFDATREVPEVIEFMNTLDLDADIAHHFDGLRGLHQVVFEDGEHWPQGYRVIMREKPQHNLPCNIPLTYFLHRAGVTEGAVRTSKALVVCIGNVLRPESSYEDIPPALFGIPIIHGTDDSAIPYRLMLACEQCDFRNQRCNREFRCQRCSHRDQCNSNQGGELKNRAVKVLTALRNFHLPTTNFLLRLLDLQAEKHTGKLPVSRTGSLSIKRWPGW